MNIHFYHNYFLNKKELFTARYIVIIVFLMIFISAILSITYIDYYKISGQVIKENDEYLVLSNISSPDLNYMAENCIINNIKNKCIIKEIRPNKDNYLILFKVSLLDKYNKVNYPINIIFEKEKTTFYKKIKKEMKGWFL